MCLELSSPDDNFKFVDLALRICGSHLSDEEVAIKEAHYAANYVPKAHSPSSLAAQTVSVQVHFHVVSANSTLQGGNVPYELRIVMILSLNQ